MFLELPLEVTLLILLELQPQDLLVCRLVSKHFDNIVRDSLELQYATALVAAKAKNNVYCNLPIAQKFQALHAAQKAWAFLRPRFSKSIPIPYRNLGASLHTGGVYFVVNSTRMHVHYFYLPKKENEDVVWKEVVSEKVIIAVGPCVDEHDLLVLITAKFCGLKRYEIDLGFVELCTGNAHPDARESCIHVMTAEWADPTVGIEIIADSLVLILCFERIPEDQIFIYHWKTGVLTMKFQVPKGSYQDIVFLTEHLMLLPNKLNKSLDVFRIPIAPTTVSPSPILNLCLPVLREGDELDEISCRSEPSLRNSGRLRKLGRHGGTGPASRAFVATAEDAICLVSLRISVSIDTYDGEPSDFEPMRSLTFIVHRNALRALVDEYAGNNSEEEGGVIIVPWATWGPPITRWFNLAGYSGGWITVTAGQRYVVMPQDWSLSGVGVPMYVLDFNGENVNRYYANAEGGNALILSKNEKSGEVCCSSCKVQPTGIFAEPVCGALPYVGCTSKARYTFDGVLLDEERVIGLKASN
ncbi:hypothetical protein M413DRAFT_75813 [Hebeloma cylindrosporum]|uniref:F-box domain-containing protein n=1 Tax=Hebeloma cylindrosporum TaxID=76867 RepID=A0A0C3BPW4_HEBCY|nr:hypothetical protein M413DRAFT_75813 [Hebeloma cylindrosporum h7]